MKFRIFLSALLVFTLTGCLSIGTVDENYRLANDGVHGIVLLSITNDRAKYLSGRNQFPPNLYACKIGQPNSKTVLKPIVGTINDKHIKNSDDWVIGRVLAVELPAGEYKIYDWDPVRVALHDSAVNVLPIDIKFNVHKDAVTYIGNIDFYVYEKENRYQFKVTDAIGRDSKHAQSKWPNLGTENIITELAVLNTKEGEVVTEMEMGMFGVMIQAASNQIARQAFSNDKPDNYSWANRPPTGDENKRIAVTSGCSAEE